MTIIQFDLVQMISRVKAVLIGNSGVGKTSIFQRAHSDTFNDEHILTVGGAFAKISITSKNGNQTEIGLWDTAGQERFRNVIPMYFQRASFIIVVYDISDKASFDDMNSWIETAKQEAPVEAKIFIVGNKCDLDNREVTFTQAQDFGHEQSAAFVTEVSAKTKFGLDILFQEIANQSEDIKSNIDDNPEDNDDKSPVDKQQEKEPSSKTCC
ncbi:small GTP-binding protein [Histomonas meleagridis]|uniref:small GTP-binding protein n=1 Tax=Histomonas meleagridis TaxID=135588 RepID=UPI0035593CEB|nr:small GTP-binding protein [Histomonas meleagridis]KAH0798015.1 small GTP-binding protein [Histomonas meleagridis]